MNTIRDSITNINFNNVYEDASNYSNFINLTNNFTKYEEKTNFTFKELHTEIDTSMDNATMDNSSYWDYEYNYDYDAAIAHLPLNELIPVTIFYSITLLSGLVGNILVIISVARFKKMQNTTNTFLLSLSTADLLLIVICVPVKVRL